MLVVQIALPFYRKPMLLVGFKLRTEPEYRNPLYQLVHHCHPSDSRGLYDNSASMHNCTIEQTYCHVITWNLMHSLQTHIIGSITMLWGNPQHPRVELP